MILLPQYRHLADPEKPLSLGHAGIQGEGRCILYDANMNIKYDSGWFRNLIVDTGLDMVGTRGTNQLNLQTYIGSGTSTTGPLMTAMQTHLAQSNTGAPGNGTQVAGIAPDYEYSEISARRFIAGVGTGTIGEIGTGISIDDTGTQIFNRVKLTVPIVKAADQVLDVFFRITIWPPATVDITGTATVDGIGYDVKTRGLAYPVSTFFSGAWSGLYGYDTGQTIWRAFDGDLGLITANTPAGTYGDGQGTMYTSAYGPPGSKTLTIGFQAELDDWIPWSLLGIRTLTGACNHFRWQTQFNATVGGARIPKDNTQIADLSWGISWIQVP